MSLLAATLLIGTVACGDDPRSTTSDAEAESFDGSAVTEAGVDSGAPLDAATDGGAADAAQEPRAPALQVGATLPAPAPSAVTPNIVLTAPETVPTCDADSFVCNGACLPRAASAIGKSQGRCMLLETGNFEIRGLTLHEGALYYGYGDQGKDVLKKLVIGTHTSSIIATKNGASAAGVTGTSLLFYTTDCATGSRFDSCLFTLPLAGGEPSRLFADQLDKTYLFRGDQAYYSVSNDQQTEQSYFRRSLTTDAVEPLFSAAKIANFTTDGSWAYANVGSFSSSKYLLTRLDRSEPAQLLGIDGAQTINSAFFEGEHLYFVRHDAGPGRYGKGSYERVKLGTSVVEPLRTLPYDSFSAVGVKSGMLYFAVVADTFDGVYRMPLAGGDLELLATFKRSDLAGVRLGDGALYASLRLGSTAVIVQVTTP